MTTGVPSLKRSLRTLAYAALTALAIPIALAAGAALPPAATVAVVVLAVFVGCLVRTLSWVAGEPVAERAVATAVTSGLLAGVAGLVLTVSAVLAGPAVLLLVPAATAIGAAGWWIARPAY